MKITRTLFDELLVVEIPPFLDHRGSLSKVITSEYMRQLSMQVDDVYITKSDKHVLRGLHYQTEPHGQVKLVSCLSGSMIDIALDIRPNSATFGKVFFIELSASGISVLVPRGFAHATFSKAHNTLALSVCSGNYLPQFESGYNPLSLDLDIFPSHDSIIISDKDKNLPLFHL